MISLSNSYHFSIHGSYYHNWNTTNSNKSNMNSNRIIMNNIYLIIDIDFIANHTRLKKWLYW